MSLLAAFFEEKRFIIVNDSLAYDGDKPAVFHSKTKSYPHLRCVINCMGSHLLGCDLDKLIKGCVLSDFTSLLDLLKSNLYSFLNFKFKLGYYDKYYSPEIGGRKSVGAILVMGYSEFDKKMTAHAFYVYIDGVDHVEMPTTGNFITHPKLTEKEEESAFYFAKRSKSLDEKETFLIEILKTFYANYKNKKIGSVPCGLEIQCTTISSEDGFYIKQSNPFRFPGFSKDMLAIHDYHDKQIDFLGND